MEYSVGGRIKCQIVRRINNSETSVEWVYGEIIDITPYEEHVNEYNYEVKLENKKRDYFGYEDSRPVFRTKDYKDKIDILVNSLKDVIGENLEMFNESSTLLKDKLREALNKVDDMREVEPMSVKLNGENKVLKANEVEITGGSTGSDTWYNCENGELYHDLVTTEVH